MAGGWVFKYVFYFMERTHKLLHLYEFLYIEWSWTWGLPTIFIWIIIVFAGDFEYGGVSTFWGYVGTNTELLCVEFCNFVQCNMFVIVCCYC
jgi:hypothetical protein